MYSHIKQMRRGDEVKQTVVLSAKTLSHPGHGSLTEGFFVSPSIPEGLFKSDWFMKPEETCGW